MSGSAAGRITHVIDKSVLLKFLGCNPAVNVYLLGDLEEPFFSDCHFLALVGAAEDPDGIRAALLIYTGLSTPCVMLFASGEQTGAATELLLKAVEEGHMPKGVFEVHLTAQHLSILRQSKRWNVKARAHERMALDASSSLWQEALKHEQLGLSIPPIVKLENKPAVVEAVLQLVAEMDTRLWFEPKVLVHGTYWGVFDESSGKLVAMAGTHVISPSYGVAALGNICTHPAYRRRGYSRAVSTRCVAHLLEHCQVRTVGLNVESNNAKAIALYESIGFRQVLSFVEADLTPTCDDAGDVTEVEVRNNSTEASAESASAPLKAAAAAAAAAAAEHS
jgi:ribosomal protein S18 acetylase RimI-like enzyme